MGTVPIMPTPLHEVWQERQRQDEQWGGSLHDDRHTPTDWWVIIAAHSGKLAAEVERIHFQDPGVPSLAYRERLLKIAALCVAAVEAMDRA